MSCPKGQYFCNDRQKCMPIPKGHKVRKDGELIKEVAPPSAKHERMIKHIKKRYAKDGKLTDKEKSIAYATAWKHYNKEEVILNIEIPSTPESFSAGLMFRESLDKDTGMFFIFEDVGEKSFHMRDTTIPLDIAFINKEGVIESIKQLKPLDETYVYSNAEVLYALEVNRDWFAENNIGVGDQIFSELNTKDVKKLSKASSLDQSNDPKDWESARARRTEIDYKDLVKQRKLKIKKCRFKKESAQTHYYKDDPKYKKQISKKTFKQFQTDAQIRKNKEQSDKTRLDTKKYGIKFTDSKGSGRIIDGKKVYK